MEEAKNNEVTFRGQIIKVEIIAHNQFDHFLMINFSKNAVALRAY